MMDGTQEHGNEVMMPEVASALKALRPEVPNGFARRAALRFETIVEQRRLRRMLLGTAGMFGAASLLIWSTVLNIGHVRDGIWNGMLAAVTILKSLFTLWDHLPGFGIVFSVLGMLLTLLLAAMVSKLDSRVFR